MKGIKHYGVKRRSGRYPWGSGGNEEQRAKSFLGYVDDLKKKGLSEVQIAEGVGMTTSELRKKKSLAKAEQRKSDYTQAYRMKEKGMSYVEIGKRMGKNESSIRSLLDPAIQERSNITEATANVLKDTIKNKKYVDVGVGTEHHMGISRDRLKTAIEKLKDEEGYTVHYIQVEQLGTGQKTTVMTLAAPDTTYSEVYKNKGDIRPVTDYSEDGGRTFLGLEPIRSVNSDRVHVRYHEEGGSDKDGVIELRRDVEDISLGNAQYAQVRIGVNDTHYLKGMAMYSDDIPKGYDMVFNTNKRKTDKKILDEGKVGAFKKMKDDVDNRFGASIKKAEELKLAQKHYIDKDGKKQLSSLNIVNEEGNWETWSKNLSSQMLSKQRPSVAKEQLGIAYDIRKTELDDIMALTNPSVKKLLLDKYADGADSAAVHLKAAALPRQSSHVILPFPKMKDTEIYAPNYRDGENVVLVRYPHGGIFEIPELKVNNKFRGAKKLIGNARDAVGINPRVAEQLSGADFDGDTVLVIPNPKGNVKKSAPLQGLADFDPKITYAVDPKVRKTITPKTMQTKMGDVSNLITDMTIRGASPTELAAAVRHSMTVIDSEKHNLDYKQSYNDNNIGDLKAKYQGSSRSGASTLISRSSSEKRVQTRKEKGIDPKTGKKRYEDVDDSYVNKKGETVQRKVKSTKMAEVDDAFELSSGTPMETVYATHANKMKRLGDKARKESYVTKDLEYSPSAKETYSTEVSSLNAKLNTALKNKPMERRAQLVANTVVSAKRSANPDMSSDQLKRIKGQALDEARTRVGAKKQDIKISTKEWEAIQAGAISKTKLNKILSNSDLDHVKALATPRSKANMTSAKITKAKRLLDSGYTQAEVADALGVSVTTIKETID